MIISKSVLLFGNCYSWKSHTEVAKENRVLNEYLGIPILKLNINL